MGDRVKRRAVERFEARAEGGPLDGLWLNFERMSDGTFKVIGGSMFGDLDRYRLDYDARIYRFEDLPSTRTRV